MAHRQVNNLCGTERSREVRHLTSGRHTRRAVEVDGVTLLSARDPPGQNTIHISHGDHRRGDYRLATFAKFPSNSTMNVIDMASNGFYYTGFRDRVKCFSCGMVAENWVEGDDANSQEWHKTDCDLINGRDCGNVPGQFTLRRAMFRSLISDSMGTAQISTLPKPCSFRQQSPFDTRIPQAIQVDAMNAQLDVRDASPPQRQHNVLELHLANIVSEEHQRLILRLDLSKESDRRKTYAMWPSYPAPELAWKLAEEGFFYLGNLDRTQCFSCSGVLRNWNRNDTPRNEHGKHFPNCLMVLGEERRNIPLPHEERERSHQQEQHRREAQQSIMPQEPADPPPEEQRHLAEHFPCQNPVNPHMIDVEARLATFNASWPASKMLATPRQIAKAGFFFLGQSDKAKCFYCNGGLQNWEASDEPWTEHAKWFPGCEFVLRRKGTEFVRRLAQENPNLNRPAIRNPVSYNIPSPTIQIQREDFSGPPMAVACASANGKNNTMAPSYLREQDACKVCKKELANSLCEPCGHIAFCTRCAAQRAQKCPICSTRVSSTIRFYRS